MSALVPFDTKQGRCSPSKREAMIFFSCSRIFVHVLLLLCRESASLFCPEIKTKMDDL